MSRYCIKCNSSNLTFANNIFNLTYPYYKCNDCLTTGNKFIPNKQELEELLMKKEDREKTNSITHLVKIVAQEVFNENYKLKEIQKQIDELEKEIDSLKRIFFKKEYAEENVKIAENSLKNNRAIWSDYEDKLLKKEFECALNNIALSHKRTSGAIRSRINQKELIWG